MRTGHQHLLENVEPRSHRSREIELHNLQALALKAEADTVGTATALQNTLALAQLGGFIRTFVDEGPSLTHLLHAAKTRGIMPEFTARLLAAFETTDDRRPTTPREMLDPASSAIGRP